MRLHPTDMQTQRRKKTFRFFHIFLFFLNRLNITRSERQNYELIGNFKSVKKIRLYPANMQTWRRKKKNSIFPFFFFYFILTVLILPDRADKNMN